MPYKHASKLMAACVVCLSLAACGNGPQANRGSETVKDVTALAKSRLLGTKSKPKAPADPVAMVDYALRVVPDAPLQSISMEKSGGFAVLTVQGVNGRNVTWVSSEQKSITLKAGLLTATRGFGGDVMSIEQGGAGRLVSGRRSGQVQKTYRFLDGQDQTRRFVVNCEITASGTEHVSTGEISALTHVMVESCQSDGGAEFKNTYWVDASGRVVQSIQWVGPSVGTIAFRRLRF